MVAGEEAVRGSWPWQTALVKKDLGLVYCGGTLIHRQWVLTAGHCIERFVGAFRYLLTMVVSPNHKNMVHTNFFPQPLRTGTKETNRLYLYQVHSRD